MLVSSWATLAISVYDNTDHFEDANGRHLFVVSISRVFETMRLRVRAFEPVITAIETIAPMQELLLHMVDALKWSLQHSFPDCGAYIALPWVRDIVNCYEAAYYEGSNDHTTAIPLTGDAGLRPTFLLILRLLLTCLDRGLLTGVTTIEDLKRLLDFLDHPALPALHDNFVTPLATAALEDGSDGAREVSSLCTNCCNVPHSLNVAVSQGKSQVPCSWSGNT